MPLRAFLNAYIHYTSSREGYMQCFQILYDIKAVKASQGLAFCKKYFRNSWFVLDAIMPSSLNAAR